MLHMCVIRRKLRNSRIFKLRPMPPVIAAPVEELDLYCYEELEY